MLLHKAASAACRPVGVTAPDEVYICPFSVKKVTLKVEMGVGYGL